MGKFEILKKFVDLLSNYTLERVGESLVLSKKSVDSEIKRTEGLYGYLYCQRLKTLLEKYQINLVLDVGANRGKFASTLRRLGYINEIISFEPTSEAFERLSQAASQDQAWSVRKIALGRENTKLEINIADKKSVFNSLLEPRNSLRRRVFKSQNKEVVPVCRLDDFLNEAVQNIEEKKIFLKMDTQGYDLEVFAGASRSYERIMLLQSEVSVIPIYKDMPHITDSIVSFEGGGFEIAGMYPVNIEGTLLRTLEFDCVMVNSKASGAKNWIEKDV
jgi:FkbM family methyltransferase